MEYKRLIYGLLLSALCLLAQGQELAVESFRFTDPLPGYMMRYDLNGERASLVKVQIPLEGLIFEGDVLGGVEYSAGEYLVYMPRGSQRLRVKAPGHYPRMVTFAEENPEIPALEGSRVYELRLRAAASTSAPAAAAAPASNYAVFQISPVHAVLTIDGKQYAVSSSGDARAFLPVGSYIYKVTAPGYDSASGTVTVGASKKSQVTVSLRKQAGTLELSCPTAGAEFYVNGNRATLKPLSLSPGYYSVEVRAPGCASEVRNVEVCADETTNCTFGELRRTSGTLNVDVSPIGADITVINIGQDGIPIDMREGNSPQLFTGLPVGQYNVSVGAKGYVSEEREVTITEGKTAYISFALKKEASAAKEAPKAPGEEYVDLIYYDAKDGSVRIREKDGSNSLPRTTFVEGFGMEIDGNYVVFSYFESVKLSHDKLQRWYSSTAPTKSEVAVLESKTDQINKTLKARGFSRAKLLGGPYYYKDEPYTEQKQRLVQVIYRGKKSELGKSTLALPETWRKYDIQLRKGETGPYGYSSAKKMPGRMDGSGYAVRGVAVGMTGGAKILSPHEFSRMSFRGEAPELEVGHTLLTIQAADSINANLSKANRALSGARGDTIVSGIPYLLNETSASTGKHLTYYFGPKGGVRAFTTSMPARVRTLLDFEPAATEPTMRTVPKNLDLTVVRDGKYGFFSKDEWRRLSDASKAKYGKIGLAVECPSAWRVLGADDYLPDTYDVAYSFFGNSLPSEELMKALSGAKIREVNSALSAFGLNIMDLNVPYWCATPRKTWTFEPEKSTSVTNRPSDFKAAMRQQVMYWAKGALPQRGTFSLRCPDDKADGVLLRRYSDGKLFCFPKTVWENLPQSVKKLYGPRK